jgi:hypothetical protein
MKGRAIISVLAVIFAVFSCRNSSRKSEEFVLANNTDSLTASVNPGFGAMEEIYGNISSPLEIANLFQVMGVPFSPNYLASSLNAKEQTTSFQKALYLGILGADLGYLNMYEKTGTSIELVSSVKKIADGLNVGQFFDFETIKRISLNKSNLDSLLFLSVDSYTRMDEYLRKNNRSQLSSIMIIGVWIEAQYFATQVMKQYPSHLLRERIGEQKYFLEDLIRIVAPYCDNDKEFTAVCSYLRDIASKYENVKISYSKGGPSSSEKDGILVVTQTETSKVEMTDEQLAEIIDITGNVRNKLIAN